jgi:hypothetical protein
MHPRTSKTLALLGGVATLALGSTFMLRLSAPKARTQQTPCAPRLLELEQAVCQPPLGTLHPYETAELAELSIHAN